MTTIKDWLVRTDTGDFVVAQKPNVWALAWFTFFAAGRFSESGTFLYRFTEVGVGVSLLIWSVLEILHGVNRFRKLLGLAGLYYAARLLMRLV